MRAPRLPAALRVSVENCFFVSLRRAPLRLLGGVREHTCSPLVQSQGSAREPAAPPPRGGGASPRRSACREARARGRDTSRLLVALPARPRAPGCGAGPRRHAGRVASGLRRRGRRTDVTRGEFRGDGARRARGGRDRAGSRCSAPMNQRAAALATCAPWRPPRRSPPACAGLRGLRVDPRACRAPARRCARRPAHSLSTAASLAGALSRRARRACSSPPRAAEAAVRAGGEAAAPTASRNRVVSGFQEVRCSRPRPRPAEEPSQRAAGGSRRRAPRRRTSRSREGRSTVARTPPFGSAEDLAAARSSRFARWLARRSSSGP